MLCVGRASAITAKKYLISLFEGIYNDRTDLRQCRNQRLILEQSLFDGDRSFDQPIDAIFKMVRLFHVPAYSGGGCGLVMFKPCSGVRRFRCGSAVVVYNRAA